MIWLLKNKNTNTFLREACPVGGMHTKQFATKEDAEAWMIGLMIDGDPGDWTPFKDPGKLREPCLPPVDKTP